MKELITDSRFKPVYVINDWGSLGYFVGTSYKKSEFGTHSIDDQTDVRLLSPCTAEVLWPDGSSSVTRIKPVAVLTSVQSNMFYTHEFVAEITAHGATFVTPVEKLRIDPTTIVVS